MRKALLSLFISILFLLMPLANAQQPKEASISDAEDYRDIKVTQEGFEVKDPYAQPVYELGSISLLPFAEVVNELLNDYSAGLLSSFDVKEAFALRILWQDIEPIFSFVGNLLSIPITFFALPFLSIARVLKLPFDVLEFLLSAFLGPVLSIPAHEVKAIEIFASSLKELFYFPSKLLKPLEFLVYRPLSALLPCSK